MGAVSVEIKFFGTWSFFTPASVSPPKTFTVFCPRCLLVLPRAIGCPQDYSYVNFLLRATQGDKRLNSLRWGISAGKPKGWWIRSGYWCGVPKREVAKATRGGHGAGWFWNDGGYEWHRKFRWWGACCSASALWSTRCYIISALTFWSQAQYLFCQQRAWFWIS